MNDLHLTIDGNKVTAAKDATILEAAESVGITIPRLCHQEGIKPSGNCRICVVEVEGSRALVGSCHTPVAEGMVVDTKSARVKKARQATIELLLAGHTGTCVTDLEARECGLHKLASDLEAGPPRFRVKKPRSYAAERLSPYVLRDMSKCILCRKCIRACNEVAHQKVYSMGYRGFESKVVVDCDVPLNKEVCKDCGICIEYCPTNALMWPEGVKRRQNTPRPKAPAATFSENGTRTRLLELLKTKYRTAGYLSEQSMSEIALELNIPLSDVYGVASFYSFLSRKPEGAHAIRICKSLPCYLKDAPIIIDTVKKVIGIQPGETTPDGRFSFALTNCIGACDQAPAMLIDDTVHGNLTPDKIGDILKSYREA
jgi:NADH:ubiquinone oxidoreductase subunit E/NAD-dependent dihydropyrimidine dehydrogenase PreA subunit/ferredoxin